MALAAEFSSSDRNSIVRPEAGEDGVLETVGSDVDRRVKACPKLKIVNISRDAHRIVRIF